ncbi:MAG: hypothetical protein IPG45_09785 [Deltaproteobacteria bacterium]|nr:hypothetical protein [Deltaproteobacteria bacterium]
MKRRARATLAVRWVLPLLGVGVAAPAEAARVGVLPLGGDAPEAERAAAQNELRTALRGLPGLELVELEGAAALLPPAQLEALNACADDACRKAALSTIRTDRLLFGDLDGPGDRRILRLRLLDGDPSGSADPKVRLSRELGAQDRGQLFSEVVAELFPEEVKLAFATLVIRGGAPETLVAVDGKLVGPLDGDQAELVQRLTPGRHHLEARAPGHRPLAQDLELTVGQRRVLSLALEKNRSVGPYVLAGVGVLAAGVATGLGLAVNGRVSDWEAACPANQNCAVGFDRARYDDDQAFVDQGRFSTNALWAVAGVALTSAVVWYLFDPGVDEEELP